MWFAELIKYTPGLKRRLYIVELRLTVKDMLIL